MRWLEVDLPAVMRKKQQIIRQSRSLATVLKGEARRRRVVRAGSHRGRRVAGQAECAYTLVSGDLREVEELDIKLREAGLDPRWFLVCRYRCGWF